MPQVYAQDEHPADMPLTPHANKLHKHLDQSDSDFSDAELIAESRFPMAEEVRHTTSLVSSFPIQERYPVVENIKKQSHVSSMLQYDEMYRQSLDNPSEFWDKVAKEQIRWISPYRKVMLEHEDMSNTQWFLDGKLNACDNCLDRWIETQPNKIAIICEPDNSLERVFITYSELHEKVCRTANLLKHCGVKKGDIVTIYLPMIPEIAITMLACARIGAVHSVVFGGYSATGLAERIKNANSHILVTADYGMRGGKRIPLKSIADLAMSFSQTIKHCLVFLRGHDTSCLVSGRDIDAKRKMAAMRPYCPLETMDSEDFLFVLYTSGSTGTPKGIMHTTAGYLVYSSLTHKLVFDYQPNDIFGCMADCGWITGHTYVVYGPLCNGATTVLVETLPTFPDPGRYWKIVDELKLSQIYVAPTAIRYLMRFGTEWPEKYDLKTLRVIGCVGEPINPEAWRWLNDNVGRGRCAIVDTFWQTETGGHVLTPLPGAIPTKPGSATVPFFGIHPVILNPTTGNEIHTLEAHGVLCIKKPWPGMMRSIIRDHHRVNKTYYSAYPGYYFTGDGAYRDMDGYFWITGRIDDTLNVSGHRIATAEVENAIISTPQIAECAVVGYKHSVKGVGIFCFVVPKCCCMNALREGAMTENDLVESCKMQVRKIIGPMVTPDHVMVVEALPKTRSGKVMRRILRSILDSRDDEKEDTSSLSNPEVVAKIVAQIENLELA